MIEADNISIGEYVKCRIWDGIYIGQVVEKDDDNEIIKIKNPYTGCIWEEKYDDVPNLVIFNSYLNEI